MDGGKNHNPERPSDERDLTAQVLEWARDRTAVDRSGSARETKPPQEGKARARPTVVVIALQGDSADRGEAHLFEDLQAAGRFVETLVENGLDQEHLIAFSCTPLAVSVSYRPVVHLKPGGGQEEVAG